MDGRDSLMLEATGFLTGPLDVAEPVQIGGLRLAQEDGRVRFDVEFDVAGLDGPEKQDLVGRIKPAVSAAVAAATGTAVEVELSHWSYPNGELRRIGRDLEMRYAILAGIDGSPDVISRATQVFTTVAHGADLRLAQLFEVYVLGVRAAQTIAPVVGLWAFATVVEEASPHSKTDQKHVTSLAAYLRWEGYDVPPTPARTPSQIRAAALHPKPQLPTAEEVAWFRNLSVAYLTHRSSTGFQKLRKPWLVVTY
jgi:hypothetical protein